MKTVYALLRNENGRLSLMRSFIFVSFIFWLVTWGYTLFAGVNYAHFETVTVAVLILVFGGIYNKQVDGKLVSIKSEAANAK